MDKPYVVLVHRIVDLRDRIVVRLEFATEQEAYDAADSIPVEKGESVEVVLPLPFPG